MSVNVRTESKPDREPTFAEGSYVRNPADGAIFAVDRAIASRPMGFDAETQWHYTYILVVQRVGTSEVLRPGMHFQYEEEELRDVAESYTPDADFAYIPIDTPLIKGHRIAEWRRERFDPSEWPWNPTAPIPV